MTVKVRRYKDNKRWEVDIKVIWADGTEHRERKLSPVASKSGSRQWGEQRERFLVMNGKESLKPRERKSVPTFGEFWPRYMQDHCYAERLKPSTIQFKQYAFDCHLDPVFGHLPLDEISNADVQAFKASHQETSAHHVNNLLCSLNVAAKKAVEWGVIEYVPFRIQLLKSPPKEMPFYDFDVYSDIVRAAKGIDHRVYVHVLLGGDAGLRAGEIRGLQWPDVEFERNRLHVRRNRWRGQDVVPKGGRGRYVPMTKRLRAALETQEAVGDDTLYVLVRDDGEPLSRRTNQQWMQKAERAVGIEPKGKCHILRHTFCSHLAIKGAPAKAIQELAGHAQLTTTMRYMHLSPQARDSAIALLDEVEE